MSRSQSTIGNPVNKAQEKPINYGYMIFWSSHKRLVLISCTLNGMLDNWHTMIERVFIQKFYLTQDSYTNLQQRHSQRMAESLSPIAVVGIGARLPGGVTSTSSLWDLLISKRDGRSLVPASRYSVQGFYKPEKSIGSVRSRYGYFLDGDVRSFDASFFSMSKAEVDKMDPQQRMLLEVVWECMESGGQRDWAGGNVGCYVGVFGGVSLKFLNINISNFHRTGSIWEQKTRKMLACTGLLGRKHLH